MKAFALLACAAVGVLATDQPTTTVLTTSYTTYLYTVYDSSSSAPAAVSTAPAEPSYPVGNATAPAPTGGAITAAPSAASPSIAAAPTGAASGLRTNWALAAGVAGLVAMAL